MGKKRFFDDRLKYLSFIQNTSEKRAISAELTPYIASMPKNRTFLRVLMLELAMGLLNLMLLKHSINIIHTLHC